MKKSILSLLIILTMLLVACSSTSDSNIKDSSISTDLKGLNEIVEDLATQYDATYMVPLNPQYPVLHVFLSNPPIETTPPDMVIHYGVNKGELLDNFKDEDFIKSYQENTGEVLYGYYEGDIIAEVAYYPIKGGKVDGEDTWVINGKEIAYKLENSQGNQLIITGIDLKKGGYRVTYHLSNTFGEEDAKDFTTFLLNELADF